MNTSHAHAIPDVTCPNCGQRYIATSTAAIGLSGSHTHSSITHMANTLAPDVVKTFAKPDPDAELNEWRKTHIG